MKDKTNHAIKPQTTFDEASTYVTQVENLKKAETTALGTLEKLNVALTEARKKQSQRLSQLVIDGKELPAIETLPEEARVQQAQQALLGIRKRISDMDIGLLTLREKFNLARREQTYRVTSDWLKKVFLPAREQYAAILRQGHALAESLGERLDPKFTENGLSQLLTLPSAHGWGQDPDAKKLHDSNIGLRTISEKLESFSFEAVARVKSNEKLYASRRVYDPSSKSKYKVVRPFITQTREYKVGDIIDNFSLDPELLRLEHGAGKLLRVLPEDELA